MGPWCDTPGPGPVPGVGAGVSHNGRTLPEGFPVRRTILPLLTLLVAAMLVVTGLVTLPSAEADGPAPKRIASGWLPYWMTSPNRPQGVESAIQNADLFSEVSPFWYAATAKAGGGVKVGFNANFTNAAANSAWAMQQLKGAGIPVLPAIVDGAGKGRLAKTLADPALRTQHVADLVNLVMANGYDGIDLDYEGFAFSDGSSSWAATQPNWTAFVIELGAALDAQGKLLSVTIPPPCNTAGVCGDRLGYWVYNIRGIAPAVDRIRIMAYDFSVNGIGPIAPMPWVRAIVQYSASIMDPAKLQIGVPTYGRAWTRKDGSKFRLTGTCPAAGTSAYRSLTSMVSVTDRDIPGVLASAGVKPEDIQWAEREQENWVYYDKRVTWTDSSGAQQVCTAKRVMWWVGPQAVLARTQLVGEFGLAGAAYWTIGGEDPSQWPQIRAYAQALAPASTDVSASGTPSVVFGSPMTVTATVGSQGAPLAGAQALLQFRPSGAKKKAWTDVQAVATGADGIATFTVAPQGTGDWQVVVPPVDARTEGVSAPFTTQVLSLVTATPKQVRVPRGGRLVVKAWARPAQQGQQLALQIQRGADWRNVATARANDKGRARLIAAVPKAKGKYTYRVVAVAKGALLANTSTEIPIRVTK
jgi:spore germination protein YaaH